MTFRWYLIAVFLLIVLHACNVLRADDRYTLKLSKIIDGDTIEGDVIVTCDWDVSVVLRKQRLRVFGVDAHELNAPGGKEAKEFVVRAIGLNDDIRLTPRGKDNFGRLLAVVRYDGLSLAEELIAKGHGVVYRDK